MSFKIEKKTGGAFDVVFDNGAVIESRMETDGRYYTMKKKIKSTELKANDARFRRVSDFRRGRYQLFDENVEAEAVLDFFLNQFMKMGR